MEAYVHKTFVKEAGQIVSMVHDLTIHAMNHVGLTFDEIFPEDGGVGSVADKRRAKAKAVPHTNFMTELYREQIEDGHYVLHEHHRRATSWKLPEIEKLMEVPGVGMTHGDQSQ